MNYQLPPLPSPSNVDILEKSTETMEWLRSNILVGYTDERGPAWWANGAVTKAGAWVGIPDGSHFAGPVPMDEAQRLLDIRLVKATRIYAEYQDENGQRQVATDEGTLPIINQRTGQIFSYPKESYKIHPYLSTLHTFIEQILHDEKVGIGSVGLLKKGGVAFLQARLPEHYEVQGYGYQPYFTAATSCDLSMSTNYGTGMLGAVCDNTVNDAIAGFVTRMKIKHSRHSGATVAGAREKLGIRLASTAEVMGEAIENLCSIEVSDRDFGLWQDEMTPLLDENGERKTGRGLTLATNERDERTRLWTKDEKVAPWTGTAFGLLQLDNTYRTWTKTVKGVQGGRLERNFSNDIFGMTANADVKALETLQLVQSR
jgi:phage/plasmid-like protein (TIGR03299 family)